MIIMSRINKVGNNNIKNQFNRRLSLPRRNCYRIPSAGGDGFGVSGRRSPAWSSRAEFLLAQVIFIAAQFSCRV